MTQEFPNRLPELRSPLLLGDGTLDADAVLPALTERERAGVRGFAAGIDAGDPSAIAVYGAAEQGAMQTWLDVAIKTVADQGARPDARGIDRMLASLRGFDRLCRARLLWFGRVRFARLRKEYLRLEPSVEHNARALLDQSVGLRRVSKVLERMEPENRAHLARLSAYQLCGQVRLADLRASGGQDLSRLEARLHDLALSRQVALQTQTQLALLLDGNARMIETMDRTLGQTLPLWKTQVLLALGLSAQAEARAVVKRARRALERDALRQSNARLLGAIGELRKASQAQEGLRLQAK